MDRYEQAKSLMSSKYPAGIKIEDVFNELLDTYIEKKAPKQRTARKSKKKTNSRYISKAIKDKIYLRDEGRCSFIGSNGVKCGSTWDLEVDHIQPYALGGGNEGENLQLLCRCHNQMRAEKTFGKR